MNLREAKDAILRHESGRGHRDLPLRRAFNRLTGGSVLAFGILDRRRRQMLFCGSFEDTMAWLNTKNRKPRDCSGWKNLSLDVSKKLCLQTPRNKYKCKTLSEKITEINREENVLYMFGLMKRVCTRKRPVRLRGGKPILKTYNYTEEQGYHCQFQDGIAWHMPSEIVFEDTPCARSVRNGPGLVSVIWKDPALHACILPGNGGMPPRTRCRDILNEHGVVILRNLVPKALCDEIQSHAERVYFTRMDNNRKSYNREGVTIRPIFNPVGKGRRLQAELTSDERNTDANNVYTTYKSQGEAARRHGLLHTIVSNAVHEHISPELHPKQNVILHSEKDNNRQYAHCDYNPVCKLQGNPNLALTSSYGIIVALEEEGTRFLCWPGTHSCGHNRIVKSEDALCPLLQRGDVLIFMDTLVHAGSDYKSANSRMHFYCENILRASKCRETSLSECKEPECTTATVRDPRNGRKKKKCMLRDPDFTQSALETFEWKGERIGGANARGKQYHKKEYDAFLKGWSYEDRRDTLSNPTLIRSITL